MNHKTFLKLISNEFGGSKQEVLEAKLKKLVDMVEQNYRDKNQWVIKKVTEPKEEIVKKIEKPIEKPYTKNLGREIKPVDNLTIKASEFGNNYEKAMKLIRLFNNSGWVHILQVPEELFSDFWAICEMHKEIQFDEERECQYFKVNNFRCKIVCSEEKSKTGVA